MAKSIDFFSYRGIIPKPKPFQRYWITEQRSGEDELSCVDFPRATEDREQCIRWMNMLHDYHRAHGHSVEVNTFGLTITFKNGSWVIYTGIVGN